MIRKWLLGDYILIYVLILNIMWRKKQFVYWCFPQAVLVKNKDNVIEDMSNPAVIALLPPREIYTIETLLAGKIPLDVIPLHLSSPENDVQAAEEVTTFMNDVINTEQSSKEE